MPAAISRATLGAFAVSLSSSFFALDSKLTQRLAGSLVHSGTNTHKHARTDAYDGPSVQENI